MPTKTKEQKEIDDSPLPQTMGEWMTQNNIVNEKGELMTFQDHQFLIEPYGDFSIRQVYKKCSQVGVSVMMMLKSAYILARLRFSIIYTLPSDSDVWEFVPSKVDKIYHSNKAIRKLLKSDKVQRKQIKKRFIYFKGTRSKTAPIMTTADILIHDEVDRSDLNIIGQYASRIKKSQYKAIWELSNPWVSNAGVDLSWRRSDQKEWFVTCENCEHQQILKWPDNIDYVKKCFICTQCKKEISDDTRRRGEWIATNPGADISGYHISQMMAPWIHAPELIKEEEEKDPEYFNNFVLGEPTPSGDVEDFRQVIIDATTVRDLQEPPYFMGIDIGRVKHYVIGNKEGIFKIGKCENREQVEDLIEKYDPFVVMDAGPERTWAEEFRKKYNKFWMNFYHKDKDRKIMIKWGEGKDTGFVYSDRNRVIDNVVADMLEGEILFDVEPRELEPYIKHWNNMVRKEEENALGQKRYVWDTSTDTAPDHWAHATVYYYIARSRGHVASFTGSPKKSKTTFVSQSKNGKISMEDLDRLSEGNE